MNFTILIDQTWSGKPAHRNEAVKIQISLNDAGDLDLVVDAPFHDDPIPVGPAGPTDRLWDYEVVELFLVGRGGHYLEVELGPHGHHLVLTLDGPRTVSQAKLPLKFETKIAGSRWHGQATINCAYIPKEIERFNAFAIHGTGAQRRYLAAYALPGEAPDFHQTHCFPQWPRFDAETDSSI